jgi:hypothetical protein
VSQYPCFVLHLTHLSLIYSIAGQSTTIAHLVVSVSLQLFPVMASYLWSAHRCMPTPCWHHLRCRVGVELGRHQHSGEMTYTSCTPPSMFSLLILSMLCTTHPAFARAPVVPRQNSAEAFSYVFVTDIASHQELPEHQPCSPCARKAIERRSCSWRYRSKQAMHRSCLLLPVMTSWWHRHAYVVIRTSPLTK